MKKNCGLIIVCLLLTAVAGRAWAASALDPSVVGVGARTLGMGRAYTAISANPDSLFLNPAALTGLSRLGLTSMYSKLINEVNYILVGASQPLGDNHLGIGYLGASLGDVQSAVRDPSTGRISFEAGTVNYYNNIIYLTYARDVMAKLSAGLNFKLYSQGYSGGGDTAAGYDADLGLKYDFSDALTFGFLERNFIPASLGGKIKWSSGAEEGIGSSSRLGLNYAPGNYDLSADYEFYLTRSAPGLLKLGAEWWLLPNFALRAGSDQDPLESNLTAGLSFIFNDFQFDYAYHQYGSLAANTTSTFSLSYGVSKTTPEKKELLVIDRPADGQTVFTDEITVEGRVQPAVKRLTVAGREVTLERDGSFHYLQPLAPGRNFLTFEAFANGPKLAEKTIGVTRLKSFADVPADYWAAVPISVLAMKNIISGYPGDLFKPEKNITRAELCSLLIRSEPQTSILKTRVKFKDLSSKHWAMDYIAVAVGEGIVKGYPDGTFRPNGLVSRAEGVAVIARFARLPEPTVLETPFADVPGRHWAYKEITAAKQAGLLNYLENKTFEPDRKLTRAEVAEILYRTGGE